MFGLLEFVKHAFRKRRSSKEEEQLTQDEIDFIDLSMDDGGCAHCPDCEEGQLMNGPTAGDSFNAACDQCGSEFNLTIAFGELMDGQRISDRGPRDLGQRRSLYGRAKR